MQQKKKLRKVMSYVLALVMVFSTMTGIVPGMSITAYAAGASYVDGSGTTQTVDATELATSTTSWTSGSWYIVPEGGLTISGRIAVGGTVNLILRDGATLTASAGIRTTGATLNIYAQSAGTGALTATGNTGGAQAGGGAGIGGNGVGGYESGGAGGTVNIYGGIVTATGGTGGNYGGGGAGIGGGGLGWRSNAGSGAGGTVNIYGGTVTATGGNKSTTSMGDNSDGAGIGGGGDGRDTSTPASGTLTLGKGVKLYNGTGNTGTVLDDSASAERSYSGSRPKNMYAEYIVQGPDKTALNDAITAAETLYNSIKDDTDYAEIVSTFKTAINTAKRVAESDEVDQDTVDTATSNIITANTNAVIKIIKALPAASGVTMDDKTVIEAVRTAYDALDDTQKTLVDANTLKKLTDAEAALKEVIDTAAVNAVSETINALPDADDVTTADKDDIEAARKGYNDLTDDQKAKVSDDTKKKLTDAEEALEVAEVIATITELPAADDVTTADKTDIEAARAAYEALTDDQKEKVTDDTLKKLTDAEDALEVAEVIEAITALPAADDVTTADKTDIEAARAAYKALTDDQKEKVSADTLKKLTDAESALEVAVVNKAIADLPNADNVTVNDKEDIEAARTAYEALTDDQKMAVGADTLAKLEAVEVALVGKTIEALPEAASVTANDKDAIEAAKAAYDALSDTQKTKVDADEKAKLEVCEVALAIAELPAASKVTAGDKKAIVAARDAYDALTKEQKAKISVDALKKLTDLEDKLLIIETVSELVSDEAKAGEVTDKINNSLPAADEITLKDETKVAAARMSYELLTDAQKNLVSEETLNKLEAAEKKISDLKEQAALEAVKESAIERLDVYAEARAKSDATADEKAAFDKAVADGKKAINEAKTQEAVAEALTNAKTLVNEAIAKIENDRAAAAAAAAEMAAADKAVEDANTAAGTAKTEAEAATANEYASDADKTAIKNAKETLDAKIKAAEELPAGATAQQKNDAAKAIEDAVKALNEAVDTANINSAAAKAEAEAAEAAAEQLAAAKTTAIDRLDIYAEARAKADATADEKTAFDKAVADGKKAINEAKTQEAVAEALTNAKTIVDAAVAKIESDRADAAAAAAEMAAADKAVEDANTAAGTAKTEAEAVTANEYASAADKTAIKNAKETLDAKIKAAEELPAGATAQQKNDAAKAIEDAVKALNKAVDTANIHSAAAKADAEAAEAAAEQLAAAKKAAKERLEDVYDAKNQTDYRAAQQKELADAREAGYQAIEEAATPAEALEALMAAKEALNAVKTDSVLTKEEKEEADSKAALASTTQISELPATDSVKFADKAAIEAAGKAYDALSADQKLKVDAATKKKLESAQAALKKLEDALANAQKTASAAMSKPVKVKAKTKGIKISWTTCKEADGYEVYVQYAGKKFKKVTRNIKKSTTGKTKVFKINGKKLNRKKDIRVYVSAYKMIDGKKVILANSKVTTLKAKRNSK